MRQFVIFLSLFLGFAMSHGQSMAQGVTTERFGQMEVQFPGQWMFKREPNLPIEGSAPDGRAVVVSYTQAPTPLSAEQFWAYVSAMRLQSLELMRGVAGERGVLIDEPEIRLDTQELFVASATSSFVRRPGAHLLQYILISRTGQYSFTLIEIGDLAAAKARWDSTMLKPNFLR